MLIRIAYAGIGAALVLAATELHIPTAIGYINLGDVVILLCSYVMGPFAFFPAAIGSALGDLLAGYPQYIIPTFMIKGLMGFVCGLLLRKTLRSRRGYASAAFRILAFAVAEIIMVAGYFIFEALPFMYGAAAALGSVPFNCIQAGVAIAAAMGLSYCRLPYDRFSGS